MARALVIGRPGADRTGIRRALKKVGLSVEEAAALPSPGRPAPALVVMDEPADGAKVPRGGAPVIVLSRRADIDSFSGALTGGAAAYLLKPLDPAALEDAAGRLARWPRTDPGGDKRQRSRRPLLLEADLEVPARARRWRVRLVDVSGEGCRLETPERLARGEEVRLIPRAIEASTEIALGAAVSRCRREPGEGYVAALRFSGTSALMAGRLFGTADADRRQTLRPSRP